MCYFNLYYNITGYNINLTLYSIYPSKFYGVLKLMIKKVPTRSIPNKVTINLWAKSAGRCEFDGCNEILYKSSTTQESVNKAQRAHIYSFSEDGPRGNKEHQGDINSEENLMLMCHQCHKLIDEDEEGGKYSARLLQKWKSEHELKVRITTGIKSDKKSHVIFYGTNISDQKSIIDQNIAREAMFPDRYPCSDQPVSISSSHVIKDDTDLYWQFESEQLDAAFTQKVLPLMKYEATSHFSIFSLAPMPLLIKLGTLFTDKFDIDTFQPIRDPKGWKWQEYPEGFEFLVNRPANKKGTPVLAFSLSAQITPDRIHKTIAEDLSIWEISVPKDHQFNDCIRNKAQLAQFRTTVRNVLNEISEAHGMDTELNIFPTMAVSCSIELGRIRMPKAEMPWVIYDQNSNRDGFIKALKIGD